MERYLSSEQCIQTERTYLNVIKDILPVILDVKSKWVLPDEFICRDQRSWYLTTVIAQR
jgi:hypothetical protein